MTVSLVLYATALALLLVGIYGMIARRNAVRIVVGLAIADLGVNVFLVTVGYIDGGLPPIFPVEVSRMVDPIPQALVLTAIVIGFGVTALALTLAMRLQAARGSVDTARIRGLKW